MTSAERDAKHGALLSSDTELTPTKLEWKPREHPVPSLPDKVFLGSGARMLRN